MDQRIRPRAWVTACIFVIFFVQAILSAFIIKNILFN
jgi:preprotein translocase subunit Sec61beta